MIPPSPSVVLIDDEQPFLDFLAFMLREHLHCPVHAFTSPRAALAALPHLHAAVVITDYCMPELDGFEFIREASQQYPALPFILISGHVIDPAAKRFREATPLRAFLPKPFGWRTLAVEILRQAPHLGPLSLAETPPASGDCPHSAPRQRT